MNLQFFNLAVVLSICIFFDKTECVPIAYPQYDHHDYHTQHYPHHGYHTGVSGGVQHTDQYHDCYESSVGGGIAANSHIGTGAGAGIHTGGIRCKQGD